MIVKFGPEVRESLKAGIDELSRAVAATLGPKGRFVAIEREYGAPLITKDGVTVARSIVFSDSQKNMGAEIIKQAASRTNFIAGDGTTTATVLSSAIYFEGLKYIAQGYNPVLLKRGMDIGKQIVFEYLNSIARPIEEEEDVVAVATISANNDSKLGYIIGSAILAVGKNGIVSVEDSVGGETTWVHSEGTQFLRGMLSPLFATNERGTCEYENAYFLLYNEKIKTSKHIIHLVEQAHSEGIPLIIVAMDVEQEPLNMLILNKQKANLKVCAVKAPGFGDTRAAMLEDLAVMLGTNVFNSEAALDSVSLNDLGRAAKVKIDRVQTVIINPLGDKQAVNRRIEILNSELSEARIDLHRKNLTERISSLSGGAATIRVGGATELEVKEIKDRIEDAINAVRAALAEGVLPGGGSALLQASYAIDQMIEKSNILQSNHSQEEIVGIKIISLAIKYPFVKILENAGYEHFEPKQFILNNKGFSGWDALRNQPHIDMLEAGIIDPLKVTKMAVDSAISAVGTLLSTEVTVSFEQKE